MRFMLMLLLVLCALPVWAAGEYNATSAISAVTVYPDRALVTRRAEVQVPAGDGVIIIAGLPANLDVSTAQVRGTAAAGLALAALEFKRTPVAEVPDAKIEELRNRIQALDDEQQAVKAKQQNNALELEMLKNLMNWQATQLREGLQTRALTAAEIEAATTVLRGKLDANRTEHLALQVALRGVQERLQLARRELAQLQHPQQQTMLQARIPVRAERAVRATIELSYLIGGASWGATYDIRALTDAGKVLLKYDAIIRQHTGEEWTAAEISLSTAQPALGAAVGDPSPLFLRRFVPMPPASTMYAPPSPAPSAGLARASRADANVADGIFAGEAEADDEGVQVQLLTAQASTTGMAVSYRITGKVTVPSDNQEHRFSIGESQLAVDWTYKAVPRLREYGYLQSVVRYDGQMVFLPGTAAVFQDDNFVGKVAMQAIAPGDTLALQFGPDRRVSAEREDVRQQREDAFGGRQRITYSCVLTLRNNRAQAVKVAMSDRVPVSSDEDITVEIDDDNPLPDLRRANGVVIWNVTLQPNETRRIPFRYTVSWPKDVNVQGLE